jgi:hypothetical protein
VQLEHDVLTVLENYFSNTAGFGKGIERVSYFPP